MTPCSPRAVAAIVLDCLPLIPFGAALMTLVASFTRSYREAQTYVSLIVFIPTMPLIFASILGLRPSLPLMAVPFLGQQFLILSLLRAQPLPQSYAFVSIGVTLLLAVALAWLVNELSGLGLTLAAGAVVTTGTCLTPLPIEPGDGVVADFGQLGRVTATLARNSPWSEMAWRVPSVPSLWVHRTSGCMALTATPELSLTRTASVLGTPAYMSPEQARGQAVDKRTDVWAFGCVLYEMLTGKKPFDGETVPDILAAVVRAEPDLSLLPTSTPPPIRNLLARCLQKDPKQRLRDIGDARFDVEDLDAGATESQAFAPPSRRLSVWGIRFPHPHSGCQYG